MGLPSYAMATKPVRGPVDMPDLREKVMARHQTVRASLNRRPLMTEAPKPFTPEPENAEDRAATKAKAKATSDKHSIPEDD